MGAGRQAGLQPKILPKIAVPREGEVQVDEVDVGMGETAEDLGHLAQGLTELQLDDLEDARAILIFGANHGVLRIAFLRQVCLLIVFVQGALTPDGREARDAQPRLLFKQRLGVVSLGG
jgi:hypothetical protein